MREKLKLRFVGGPADGRSFECDTQWAPAPGSSWYINHWRDGTVNFCYGEGPIGAGASRTFHYMALGKACAEAAGFYERVMIPLNEQ